MKATKATPVVVTIPTAKCSPVVKAINGAESATDTAITELEKLDSEYATMKAKHMAEALIKAGAKWSINTIMQELSRIRALKKAGKWAKGMTSYQVREAQKALPKTTRAKADKSAPVANGSVSKESEAKLTGKISREPPTTIANALIEALIQSGIGDLEAVLAEARRLVIQAVNDKKPKK